VNAVPRRNLRAATITVGAFSAWVVAPLAIQSRRYRHAISNLLETRS